MITCDKKVNAEGQKQICARLCRFYHKASAESMHQSTNEMLVCARWRSSIPLGAGSANRWRPLRLCWAVYTIYICKFTFYKSVFQFFSAIQLSQARGESNSWKLSCSSQATHSNTMVVTMGVLKCIYAELWLLECLLWRDWWCRSFSALWIPTSWSKLKHPKLKNIKNNAQMCKRIKPNLR